jgi:Type III restriction enzyme, res subunit
VAFDRRQHRSAVPQDPEALYRDLARTNNGPNHPWSHQTDLLRDWHTDYRQSPDVALELPTGAGKTLVGGLIAEWLRLSERQPVAYLCPNNQLAAQAADRLDDYGIVSVLLTGPSRRWDPAERSRFTTGDAVAVSTYHHLFNSNPALTGAGTLVLDDAHAGEQPVAAAWSITIERDQPGAYQAVLSVVADGLDQVVVHGLRDDNSVRKYHRTVHLVSPVVVAERAGDLERVLDDAVGAGTLTRGQGFTLSTLAGHLGRCLVYVSHRRFLIRPLISPTGSHPAFDDPKRRVYMSATLGAGGELERAFGRATIQRMPVPRGWDKQGTGRRFFVFPELTKELANDDTQLAPWLAKTIAKHGRAALITPAGYVSDDMVTAGVLPTGYTRMDGHSVEKDMTLFTREPKALLDLPNRYDGVDLPDDTCRLLVLAGLPAQGDLQERFLYEALGAGAVLQERVRARVVQGAGRATRNPKDHATVVVIGDELTNFVIRGDVLAALREELQAEIAFGYAQSTGKPVADVDDNIDTFLAQGDDWRDVEDDIVDERDHRTRTDPPATKELAAAAPAEVAAVHAWWDGDLDTALAEATNVLDALGQNPRAARYAALWNYLAASWTRTLARDRGDPSGTLAKAADGYLTSARACGRGTSWLSHLANRADVMTSADQYDDLDRLGAKNILALLRTWSPKNLAELDAAQLGLSQTRYKPYEAGLKVLGKYAGAGEAFDAGGAHAAPDATWIFGDALWVCWEAKSEASADSTIATAKVREANGHLRFVEAKRRTTAPTGSFTCFATPQTAIDHSAKAVCEDTVFHVASHVPADMLARFMRALHSARRLGPALDDAGVLAALKSESCLPSQWSAELAGQPLGTLGN